MRKRIGNRTVPTLSEAITAYMTQREVSGVRPHTVSCERSLLHSLLRLVGDKPVDKVTIADIEGAITTRRAEGLSTNSLNHLGRMSKRFFGWLTSSGLIAENAIAGLRVVRVEQAKTRPMKREQVTQLLAACDCERFSGVRNRLIIILLYDTGLRASEALGIRLADIDMPARSIQVIGKGGRPRHVCFGRQVAVELQTYLARRGNIKNHPWLFVDEWGTNRLTYDGLRHAMERLADRAGLEDVRASCHTLRHSFAREWVLAGGDMASLSAQLGHSNLEMTSRYVNTLLDDIAQVHERVSPADRLVENYVRKKRL